MLLRALPWIVWAAIVLFSIATYGGLPDELPRHLNAAGEVTRSDAKTWLNWMLLPLIAGVTQGILHWLGNLLQTQPELFNFPAKERFLKIPAAYHEPVIARMREVLDVTGAFVMLLMGVVQVALWRAALGHDSGPLLPVLLTATIALVPIVFLLTARVNAAVDDAERLWRAREPEQPAR